MKALSKKETTRLLWVTAKLARICADRLAAEKDLEGTTSVHQAARVIEAVAEGRGLQPPKKDELG